MSNQSPREKVYLENLFGMSLILQMLLLENCLVFILILTFIHQNISEDQRRVNLEHSGTLNLMHRLAK